ncbi:MAG: alpha/beta hydrolase [Ardenticatenaceae bacterium]|nr:alpha/beta hydrolase [Ardenticatenaceae bacterium]
MKMQFFTTDDQVKLGYSDKGSGIPVILIAGYSAPATSWYDQEKVLLKHGCRVIAFDRRSHGSSANPPFGQDMATQGKDLAALLHHLQLDKAFLIGQSQGASTMWAYIAQFGTERLYGVISIDQTPKMLNSEDWPYGMVGLNAATRPTFFDHPLPKPNKKAPNFMIILMMFLRGVKYLKFDHERTKPLLLDHADADWRETLKQTDVPVLFVAGAESPFWPKEHATASAALCPQGEAAIIAGSGHAVNWECPKEFDEIMLEFLTRFH